MTQTTRIIMATLIGLAMISIAVARPFHRPEPLDGAYCAAVKGALAADLGVSAHRSLDFNKDGLTTGSDLSFFASRATNAEWCRQVLKNLVDDSTRHGRWD